MGFFRRHKASRYSLEDAEKKTEEAFRAIQESEEVTESLLIEWAAWRELLARLQNDNLGREQ